jgi:hypothetical protein
VKEYDFKITNVFAYNVKENIWAKLSLTSQAFISVRYTAIKCYFFNMDIEIPQAVEQAYRWPISVAAIFSSVAIRWN